METSISWFSCHYVMVLSAAHACRWSVPADGPVPQALLPVRQQPWEGVSGADGQYGCSFRELRANGLLQAALKVWMTGVDCSYFNLKKIKFL